MTARSIDIGTGADASGKPYIARWTLIDGHPRCVEAPLAIGETQTTDLAASIALNRAVAAIAARAEQVEAARILAQGEAPLESIISVDPDGQPVQTANPARLDWDAANSLLAATATDSDLQHLLRTRADALMQDEQGVPTEPPFASDLPPVPTIPDPLTQTADWDGQAWQVRSLTPDEQASWPLRPAVSLDKLRFAALLRAVLGDVRAGGILTSPDVALALTLAGRVDWTDVFVAASDGPAYADRLLAAGAVSAADIAALKDAWPMAMGSEGLP